MGTERLQRVDATPPPQRVHWVKQVEVNSSADCWEPDFFTLRLRVASLNPVVAAVRRVCQTHCWTLQSRLSCADRAAISLI